MVHFTERICRTFKWMYDVFILAIRKWTQMKSKLLKTTGDFSNDPCDLLQYTKCLSQKHLQQASEC